MSPPWSPACRDQRINKGCFRLDLGEIVHMDQLIIHVPDDFSLQPLLRHEGNHVEISQDLKTWKQIISNNIWSYFPWPWWPASSSMAKNQQEPWPWSKASPSLSLLLSRLNHVQQLHWFVLLEVIFESLILIDFLYHRNSLFGLGGVKVAGSLLNLVICSMVYKFIVFILVASYDFSSFLLFYDIFSAVRHNVAVVYHTHFFFGVFGSL